MFSPLQFHSSTSHFQTVYDPPATAVSASACISESRRPSHYAPHGYSGDGWKQMLLPIPVDVDPWQFLADLRTSWEEESLNRRRLQRQRLDGTAIPDCDVGKLAKLLQLPQDVWEHIATCVLEDDSGVSLARSSRSFHSLITPLLFKAPIVKTPRSLHSLVGVFSSASPRRSQHPASLVSSLELELQTADWGTAIQLAKLLATHGAVVTLLRLKCAGSDAEMCGQLFKHLRPRAVEWTTSPCWLIRPPSLLSDILLLRCGFSEEPALLSGQIRSDAGQINNHAPARSTSLDQIEVLRLSGFYPDDCFLQALLPLHSLRTLILSGRTVHHMRPAVLHGLLFPSQTSCRDSSSTEDELPITSTAWPPKQLNLQMLCIEDADTDTVTRLLTDDPIALLLQEPSPWSCKVSDGDKSEAIRVVWRRTAGW
ncbi:unnamed protein product [Parajaminaea phylloscopi]